MKPSGNHLKLFQSYLKKSLDKALQLISGQFNFFAPLPRKTSIFEGNKTGSKASFFKNHNSAWEGCNFLVRTLVLPRFCGHHKLGSAALGKQPWRPSWRISGPSWAVSEAKLGVLRLTWEHLGANLGGFGANLAVLEAT